jgi:cytidylate kinase
MGAITIISGCLGTGKTVLSKALAHADPAGLHFVTDTFYAFPAHGLDPTTEEAHGQNVTIMTAIGRAAAAFSEGGYTVFLDGVVGPWFLPTLAREWGALARVEYVVLRATLAEELRRVLKRDGPVTSHRVCNMHEAFADLKEYETHVIETTQRTPDEVRAECIQRRQRQEFVLDTRSLVA